MMATLVALGKDGRGGVVEHFGIGFLGCQRDGMVGIVYHQLLAEGVDKTACASSNPDFHGIELLDRHRVAQTVAPQAVGRGDDEFIGASGLNFPDGIDLGSLAVAFLDGQELVEDAHVEQEQHGLARPIALHGKKALAGVVGVHEVHLAHVANLLILLPVGLKGDATVEEHLQIGPHLMDAGLAGAFEHPPE